MEVYRDTAQHASEAASETVAVGTSFIDNCRELDDRMEGVVAIGAQLREMESALTALEAAVDASEAAGGAEAG